MSEFREGAGLTLRELSAIVNISAGQLSNYERGTSRPKKEAVIAIAKAIGLPTDTALLASGYSPLYYSQGDKEAMQIAEETAVYFGAMTVYSRVAPLIQKVVSGGDMQKLKTSITEANADAELPPYLAAALAKADIAMKLLEDAAFEITKARNDAVHR
ncbi:helix-turn-helix transcriptional regulator [Paenibacillus sp. FSL K6-3166]